MSIEKPLTLKENHVIFVLWNLHIYMYKEDLHITFVSGPHAVGPEGGLQIQVSLHSGPCILRQLLQPENFGLKFWS